MAKTKNGTSNLTPKLITVAVAGCFAANTALSNPTGASVANGAASIRQAGNLLQITNSPNAIVNWQSFSIGAGEITRFIQQSASSAVLNRVVTQDPSSILGALQSNGRVFLINPNGITFGAGSQVNVAGLVASSLNLADADFLAGRLRFTATPAAGSIGNAGNISTDPGGHVYLVGPAVTNSGIITSPKGEVVLAAGNTVELVNPGTPNLKVEIVAPDNQAVNLGSIVADSGRIGIYAGLISQSGTLRADSMVSGANGQILLKATQSAILDNGSITSASGGTQGGNIEVSAPVVLQVGDIRADGDVGGKIQITATNYLQAGILSASGSAGAGGDISVNAPHIIQTSSALIAADGTGGNGGNISVDASGALDGLLFSSAKFSATGNKGGNINLLGHGIVLLGASADASGVNGGGSILVGGDFQGKNPTVPNAANTSLNFSTTLSADALAAGDGGKVVVWSDAQTQFYGTVSARGGTQSGDGGRIEISGKDKLVFGGFADAGAPNGAPGTLLLDPKNIIIDAAATGGLGSFQLVDPHPGAGEQFGSRVVVLTNQNVVVTDPRDSFTASLAGAVYLFNSTTGALISTLTGSLPNDSVGNGGVTTLTNGNYVVRSFLWNNGAVARAGAATWVSGTTGISGAVSAANSLVGSTTNDQVSGNSDGGPAGVTALSNGNYVVASPSWNNGPLTLVGAATWGSGTTGVSGVVSAANSLVGSSAGDFVGVGVTALTNGNYVVASSAWSNGPVTAVGAATWGNGTTGITGAVSAANSLVGSTFLDQVGSQGVTALANGNYVVVSSNWNNGAAAIAGAATWGSGASGITGTVSTTNSLVGTTAGDLVGIGGVTALTNSNYVVSSARWNTNAGAATWGSGTTGVSGAVSAANSLVGSITGDSVSGQGVTALTNGNYVVSSMRWNNNLGAATWGSGTTGISGAVSAANSLVGSSAGNFVGSSGVTALTNGNYVVASAGWSNGPVTAVGAATWGNGTTGIIGAVTAANSLVGSTASDAVGTGGVTALTNGNYVVRSYLWNNGAATSAGAATWGSGTTGIIGTVSAANSLVGTTAGDLVGIGGVTALTNGNYVVRSYLWNNGVASAGAATWGSGTTGVSGAVSAANSLVGSTASDQVGGGGVTALFNGNYVVVSNNWSNGAAANAGAVTFGSGTTGIAGAVSAANSLVGTTAGDLLGSGGVRGLSNGSFVVSSPNASNGGLLAAGLVHVVTLGAGSASGQTFASNPGGDVTITPATITAITDAGTALVLQANNDLTLAVASPITTSAGGAGGALTMQAGRSVLLNSNITTDNGALTIVANERVANGVLNANRDAGAAVITQAAGTTLNAGTANISLTINDGAGLTNATSGNITLANLNTTGHVLVKNIGPTAGSGIVRADATQLITASSVALDVSGTGGSGMIGTSGAPIRVTAANLAARSQAAGAFFSSPTQGLTIGGAILGGLTGISTSSNGIVQLSTAGAMAITEAISTGSGAVNLTSSGALSESGTGAISTAGLLTTSSAGGETLGGTNTVGSFNATNLTSGNVQLTNAGSLTITGISETVGSATVANTGLVAVAGAVNGTAVNLTVGGGALTEGSSGLITASTINLSAANGIGAAGAPMLVQPATSAGLSATNTVGGDIVLTQPSGNLVLGTGGATLSNVPSAGYVIGAGGNITLNGSVPSTGNMTLAAGNNINVASAYSTTGSVAFTAANSINVSSNMTAGGNMALVAPTAISIVDAIASAAGAVSATGGALNITATTTPTKLKAGTNTTVGTASVMVQGGSGAGASAELTGGPGTFNVTTSGNVTVNGGSGIGAFARIIGNPDFNPLTVGGLLNMTTGTGSSATATIESVSPFSIHVNFPLLLNGGYFVNGVGNVIRDPVTGSGFVAGGLTAILNTNLFINYIPAVPPVSGLPLGIQQIVFGTYIGENARSIPSDREKDKDLFAAWDDQQKKENLPQCR